MLAKQRTDRTAGRFAMPQLRTDTVQLAVQPEFYSDDDPIAAVFEELGDLVVYYGVVEKCMRLVSPLGKASKMVNVELVHVDDASGRLRVRWFDALGKQRCRGSQGGNCLQFVLPVCSVHGLNDIISTDAVICPVAMEMPTPSRRSYLLSVEDEKVVNQFLAEKKVSVGPARKRRHRH